MENVKDIISAISPLSKSETQLIIDAFEFAKKAHKEEKRFSGEPYFTHLFETAKILSGLRMSPTTIAAGLLHDSIEDANIEEEEIKKLFGEEILFLVRGVTKLGKLK
jgi:GTP diphosphokinase / guanosine-3',5'-bis(diphosphate) 3'-diphosphatase